MVDFTFRRIAHGAAGQGLVVKAEKAALLIIEANLVVTLAIVGLNKTGAECKCEIPRMAYAEAVTRLTRWGAKAIVFDLMFRQDCPREDPEVAAAFDAAGNVVLAAYTQTRTDAVSLEDPVLDVGD